MRSVPCVPVRWTGVACIVYRGSTSFLEIVCLAVPSSTTLEGLMNITDPRSVLVSMRAHMAYYA